MWRNGIAPLCFFGAKCGIPPSRMFDFVFHTGVKVIAQRPDYYPVPASIPTKQAGKTRTLAGAG